MPGPNEYTYEEKRELINAITLAFRNGEIGVIRARASFQALQIGMREPEIEEIIRQYRAENEENHELFRR